MELTSPAFDHGQSIPATYTCDGADTSVPLTVAGVPDEARSLALIVDDTDAPAGTWVHWLVWNVSPDTTTIAAGAVPDGAVEGVTSFGRAGYGGPCPPSGRHRYFWRLYALGTDLELGAHGTRADLETAMAGHVVAQTELMGVYTRQ